MINWTSVLENIIAGSLIALVFGVFLTWLLNWRNRPKLRIILNLEDPPKPDFYWASVQIANYGRNSFREKEVNWHLYWPHTLLGHVIDEEGRRLEDNKRDFKLIGESEIKGVRFSHFTTWTKSSLVPGRETLVFKFRFDKEPKPGDLIVRYQFSTPTGAKPKWVRDKWRFKKIDDKMGFPRLHLLPLAQVRDIRNSAYTGSSYIPPEEVSGNKF